MQYYDFILQPDHFYFIYYKFRPLENATEKNFKKLKDTLGEVPLQLFRTAMVMYS